MRAFLFFLTLANVGLLFFQVGVDIPPLVPRILRSDGGNALPSLSIQCRLFGGRLQEAWLGLIPSMQLFLPWQDAYRAWPGLEVALIWDGESQNDQHAATLLSSLPPYPRAFMEAPCPPMVCRGWGGLGRGAGYSRQQYSNFWGDLYTNATLIGFVDSDSVFVSPLIPSAVVGASTGKPIILAYQGGDFGGLHGVDYVKQAIGRPMIIARMVASTFPVLIRAKDLRPMREFIVKHMGVKDFGEAWGEVSHGQFDIMANWLWWHRRDEYEWHLKDLGANPSYGWQRSGAHTATSQGDAGGSATLTAANTPLPFITKNAGHDQVFLPVLAEYICLALRTSPSPRGACDASASAREGQLAVEWEDWLLRSLRNDNNIGWASLLPPRGYPAALAQAPTGNQDQVRDMPMDNDWNFFYSENSTWSWGEGASWMGIYEDREREFLSFKAENQGVGGTGILPFAPVTASQGWLCTPWEEGGKEVSGGGGCSPQGILV